MNSHSHCRMVSSSICKVWQQTLLTNISQDVEMLSCKSQDNNKKHKTWHLQGVCALWAIHVSLLFHYEVTLHLDRVILHLIIETSIVATQHAGNKCLHNIFIHIKNYFIMWHNDDTMGEMQFHFSASGSLHNVHARSVTVHLIHQLMSK